MQQGSRSGNPVPCSSIIRPSRGRMAYHLIFHRYRFTGPIFRRVTARAPYKGCSPPRLFVPDVLTGLLHASSKIIIRSSPRLSSCLSCPPAHSAQPSSPQLRLSWDHSTSSAKMLFNVRPSHFSNLLLHQLMVAA